MIISLITTLLGAFFSWVPDLMKFFQDKRDKAHEIEMLRLQADIDAERRKTENSFRLQELEARADIAEMHELAGRVPETNVAWVTALNALVRPVISLSFFSLYAACKASYVYGALHGELLPWQSLASVLWTLEDQALFGSIMGFYFGGRLSQKIRQGR